MSTSGTPPKLHPAAVPYWRAGLRVDDASTAARVTSDYLREQRNAVIRAAIDAGHPVALVAGLFGVSVATVRRAVGSCHGNASGA